MADKTLEDTLHLLGLTSREIRFFNTCFEAGPLSINEAAKRARVKRSTAYLIVDSLREKDLITEDFRNYKKNIYAVDPQKLLRIVATKQRTLRRLEVELDEKLPELQAVYQVSEVRPRVRVFEGNSGLLSIWEDILASKAEILLWTNQETESLFFTKEFHKKFIEERVKKNIGVKVLAVNNKKGQLLKSADNLSLRYTKLLPKEVIFSSETYIYGNKIATLDYKKDIIGVIVESEPIAEAQKAIFNMVWTSISAQ